jgi:uncharacterized membrane protein YjgN (DUF898 family)
MQTNPQRRISFTGEGSSLFGTMIANYFLTIITLFIYFPWAQINVQRFFVNNTKFDDVYFNFDGKGIDNLIGFLKGFGLVILWAVGNAFVIQTQNPALISVYSLATLILLSIALPYSIHSGYKYDMTHTTWKGARFEYTGKGGEFIPLFMKGFLLSVFTLGIYLAWFSASVSRYLIGHTKVANISFRFDGKGSELLKVNLKGLLLTILTLGFYFSWWQKNSFAYSVRNTKIVQNGRDIDMENLASGSDFLIHNLVNALMFVFTLGIATPWILVRNVKMQFTNIAFEGELLLEKTTESKEMTVIS